MYGKQTAIFAELSLTCMDSHRVTVATDVRWQWYLGQHREAEFYHGERIDRTAVPTAPQPVVLAEDLNAHAPALVPQQCEPVRVLRAAAPLCSCCIRRTARRFWISARIWPVLSGWTGRVPPGRKSPCALLRP